MNEPLSEYPVEQEFRDMCGKLRACVVKHGLGLGGEDLAELVIARVEALQDAANLLLDYCEAHEWGMMPEPFASINPLLALLVRKDRR